MTSELRPAVAVWIDAREAYARSHKPDPKGGRYTFADPFAPVAVIEADREAVRAEQAAELAKFKALAETLAGALGDIFEWFDAKPPNHRGNAPGHGHETPGIWDADNGEKAGQPCVWCKDWNSARETLRQYKEARDER